MAGILGVITTRGGAGGMYNTYTRNLAGTPLVAYSLREADKSKHLQRTILSTDSKEVARAAGLYSTKTIVRPNDLAGENVARREIVKHALEELKGSEGYEPSLLVVLPASCPLRLARSSNSRRVSTPSSTVMSEIILAVKLASGVGTTPSPTGLFQMSPACVAS